MSDFLGNLDYIPNIGYLIQYDRPHLLTVSEDRALKHGFQSLAWVSQWRVTVFMDSDLTKHHLAGTFWERDTARQYAMKLADKYRAKFGVIGGGK